MPEGTPAEAMRRVADAILAGDYMTPMAEVTPDAMLQIMQIGGGMMNLSAPESADVEPLGSENGAHNFRITFHAGGQTLSATVTWGDVEGFWRITGISDVVFPTA
jgi:hypothetical protein